MNQSATDDHPTADTEFETWQSEVEATEKRGALRRDDRFEQE